jgi:SAM-dependent methyltransferase
MVRAAAELQRTGTMQYGRRLHGRVCETVTLRQVLPENVFFMVADALDPPFAVSSFDLVAALNLVENVAHPQVLLAQASALLKAGGTLLFGSPYEWRQELSDPGLWFETGKIGPAELTKGILEGKYYPEMGLDFRITREIDTVPWPLRRHSRHWSVFLVHLLKAVKNFTESSYCRDDATV